MSTTMTAESKDDIFGDIELGVTEWIPLSKIVERETDKIIKRNARLRSLCGGVTTRSKSAYVAKSFSATSSSTLLLTQPDTQLQSPHSLSAAPSSSWPASTSPGRHNDTLTSHLPAPSPYLTVKRRQYRQHRSPAASASPHVLATESERVGSRSLFTEESSSSNCCSELPLTTHESVDSSTHGQGPTGNSSPFVLLTPIGGVSPSEWDDVPDWPEERYLADPPVTAYQMANLNLPRVALNFDYAADDDALDSTGFDYSVSSTSNNCAQGSGDDQSSSAILQHDAEQAFQSQLLWKVSDQPNEHDTGEKSDSGSVTDKIQIGELTDTSESVWVQPRNVEQIPKTRVAESYIEIRTGAAEALTDVLNQVVIAIEGFSDANSHAEKSASKSVGKKKTRKFKVSNPGTRKLPNRHCRASMPTYLSTPSDPNDSTTNLEFRSQSAEPVLEQHVVNGTRFTVCVCSNNINIPHDDDCVYDVSQAGLKSILKKPRRDSAHDEHEKENPAAPSHLLQQADAWALDEYKYVQFTDEHDIFEIDALPDKKPGVVRMPDPKDFSIPDASKYNDYDPEDPFRSRKQKGAAKRVAKAEAKKANRKAKAAGKSTQNVQNNAIAGGANERKEKKEKRQVLAEIKIERRRSGRFVPM